MGHETDTQDAEGGATLHGEWGHVTGEKVDAALGQFVGDITQVPPMFSALHKDGKRLYELARKGITVRKGRGGAQDPAGVEGVRATYTCSSPFSDVQISTSRYLFCVAFVPT